MRILIAEDDPFSLMLLRTFLESANHSVVATKDGNEAWATLERDEPFDLCIFDIMMPDLDGLQLTRRLRADSRFRTQRVILCTALSDRTTVNQAASIGVSHYIVKPYAREHILKQIRRISEEQENSVRFEPLREVSARLGIEADQVVTFLLGLHRDVGGIIAFMRTAAPTAGGPALAMKLNALQGGAINLGARRLAEQLIALENYITSHGGVPEATQIDALESENERVHAVAWKSPVLTPAR